MTEVVPYSKEDARLMWRVFARWVKELKERKGSPKARSVQNWVQRNYAKILTDEALDFAMPKRPLPLKSGSTGWIVGAPLNRAEHVIPVASVGIGEMVGQRMIGLAIRVALLHEREDGTVLAEGWRFEQGEVEDEPPAHPYAHAQAIIGWEKGSDCLLHPPHVEGDPCNGINLCNQQEIDGERKNNQRLTLVKHPAFPLGVRTMTGLALNVLATLYGNVEVAKVINNDTMFRSVPGPIDDDLRLLHLR